jgi:hypothetical protein
MFSDLSLELCILGRIIIVIIYLTERRFRLIAYYLGDYVFECGDENGGINISHTGGGERSCIYP